MLDCKELKTVDMTNATTNMIEQKPYHTTRAMKKDDGRVKIAGNTYGAYTRCDVIIR